MNIEDLRSYCLAKRGVTEDFPFGKDTLVFRVLGKIFLLTGLDKQPLAVNLKMAEELVPEFREKYIDVVPGYHMNKKHWNTVIFNRGNIPQKELLWMVDHSYEMVLSKMPKKLQHEFNQEK